MPYYESVFIARQDVSAAQVDSLTDDFSKVIEDGGGKVAKKESWGLRTLAYKIKSNRKGHYTLLNIDAPSGAVQEMERLMRINDDILRYLTVKVDKLEEGPSVILASRPGRDERPRRSRNDDYERQHRSQAKKEKDVESGETVKTGKGKDDGKFEDAADKTGDDA